MLEIVAKVVITTIAVMLGVLGARYIDKYADERGQVIITIILALFTILLVVYGVSQGWDW